MKSLILQAIDYEIACDHPKERTTMFWIRDLLKDLMMTNFMIKNVNKSIIDSRRH